MAALTSAELVRDLRRRSGLSQRDLAHRAGTSGPTIAAYEAGTKEPRLSTLERLADAAGQRIATDLRSSDDGDQKRQRRRMRSLALGAATAEVVRRDWKHARALALKNLQRTSRVIGDNRAQQWIDDWQRILDDGPRAVRAALVDRSAHGDDLRQMQPFAGLLTDEERALVLAAIDGWTAER